MALGLSELMEDFDRAGVTLVFVGLQVGVRQQLVPATPRPAMLAEAQRSQVTVQSCMARTVAPPPGMSVCRLRGTRLRVL